MFQRAYNLCIIYNLLLITWVSAESAMVGDDDPYVTNFCNYKCDLRKNICCLYSTTKFGDDCGDSAVVMDLSDDEIEIMVSKLNELRNQIAAGKSVRSDIRGITAADMHALSYSRELAYSASCWAMQCKLAHSRCKASKDGVLGETICWQSTLKEKNATAEVARQVLTKCPAVQMQNHPQLTTKVIDQLTFTSVGDDEKNRETIQLMWAKTEYIGCSRVRAQHADPLKYIIILVCHYFPAGNIGEQPVFRRGPPVSKCVNNDSRNPIYENLCGDVRPANEDYWKYGLHASRFTVNKFVILILLLFSI